MNKKEIERSCKHLAAALWGKNVKYINSDAFMIAEEYYPGVWTSGRELTIQSYDWPSLQSKLIAALKDRIKEMEDAIRKATARTEHRRKTK